MLIADAVRRTCRGPAVVRRPHGAGNDGAGRELARTAAFRTELRRFLRRTETVADRAGLTPQRYDLLLMIKTAAGEPDGVRLTDLCELLQLRQPAVTELVKRAEEAGLVTRGSTADDRRVSLLRLTADGEARLMRAFDGLRADRVALAEAFSRVDLQFRAASG
jgi:DNA-binding MarR family transcriptional regulator